MSKSYDERQVEAARWAYMIKEIRRLSKEILTDMECSFIENTKDYEEFSPKQENMIKRLFKRTLHKPYRKGDYY